MGVTGVLPSDTKLPVINFDNKTQSYDVIPAPSEDRKQGIRYQCSKTVRQKLPILKWLPKYRREYLLPDMIAGFTVWMTAIPASMGDAAIAGVSPEVCNLA